MQPFVQAGKIGCGLHDRGATYLQILKAHTDYCDCMWREEDVDTYSVAPHFRKYTVRIQRVNESMYYVFLLRGDRVLFYTMASDIWEAKIVGDVIITLASNPACRRETLLTITQEVFGWDETFVLHFMRFLTEEQSPPTTTKPSSLLTKDSYLKDTLLQNGGKMASCTFTNWETAVPVV